MRMLCCLMMTLVLAAACVAAEPFPPLVFPQGVGVNIHFTRGHEKDLDMIAAAGIKVVRMDMTWAGIERKQGEYDFSAYDELTANLLKRGLRPLYILDYSNRLYEPVVEVKRHGKLVERVASPDDPESAAAFARWAGAAAKRYQGKGVIWEIWNEPNLAGFWAPEPNVEHYIQLARATCAAIRAADKDAVIIAPGSSQFAWEFQEAMFKAGLLEQLDGVSVHPYRHHLSPETVEPDYRRLRGLIDQYAPAGRKIAILSGEWGYTTADGPHGITLEQQARYIVRQQITNVLWHVPVSIWYDWINDGPDPKEHEHNFGIVFRDHEPKPSYRALQTMTRQLAGYRIERRIPLEKPEDFAIVCTKEGGAAKLVAWTIGEARQVTLAPDVLGAAKIDVADLYGAPSTAARIADGKLTIDLTDSPIYVTFKP